jgi:hypothetical protein
MGPKSSKKHYLEEVFATRFRDVGKPYKTNENTVFQNAKTRRQNPYKTLLKLIIFEPFSEKGLQNHQKSIT